MKSITLNIDGMTCQGCVNSVSKVLTPIKGVTDVKVTLQPGQATVNFDADQTTVDVLRQAIEGAGFDVTN